MYYTAAAGHRPLHIMSNNWGMGESSAAACPDCKGILFGIFPVPRYGDSDAAAGMAAAQGIHDGYGTTSFANNAVPPSPVRTIDMYKDVRYIQGHAAALMWARGVELAVTQMAGSKPTAAEIKVALESFRSERLFGMTTGPVSFSATDHRPQTEAWIYQLESVGVGGQLGLVAAKKVSMSTITDWIGW
jgi:branched-chain amino acid transport system substrate-binding protein